MPVSDDRVEARALAARWSVSACRAATCCWRPPAPPIWPPRPRPLGPPAGPQGSRPVPPHRLRATVEDGPALLARRFQPDVVQLKCNLLDQRAQHSGALAELAALDVAIHAASVFADGLLFMSGEALPLEMHRHAPTLPRIRRRLAEARVD